MPTNPSAITVRLWYTQAEPVAPSVEQQQLSRLPPAQQQYYKSLSHPGRRQQYFFSRLLICTALSELFNRPLSYWKIEERSSNSAPVICNLPTPGFISLTHSNAFVCFALSTVRVGIDVEYRKQTRDFISAAELFMSAAEKQLMPNSIVEQRHYFYRLWCAKEAFYKALPATEQQKTTLVSLAYHDLKSEFGQWHLYETELDQYHIAVVSLSRIKPDLLYLQLIR